MNSREGDEQAYLTAETVARNSYGKLVALLAARTGDVAAAEDALSEAFASALTDWPRKGGPANPEGWLLAVAQRKLIDAARGRQRHDLATSQLQIIGEGLEVVETESEIPDRRLALMFACAHPAIDAGIRAPLILQTVLGFDAAMIASAFLISPTTMGQRLVRAKNKIRDAGIPFRIPEREELPERLETVLDAIYAAFGAGWIDATGTDIARRGLATEAIFLGQLVTDLLPHEPEALGLLALMLYTESRQGARRSAEGEYVPFMEQDQSLWDARKIDLAESLIRRAGALNQIGRYQLEAALQSAHIYRRRTGKANWADVVQLYDALLVRFSSPVVAINRALALANSKSPQAGLDALREVADDRRLCEYQPYWAARAELLARIGARGEAGHAYEMAIGLEIDPAVRRFLQRKKALI